MSETAIFELQRLLRESILETHEARTERDRLRAAILFTLAENAHLADGDDCTLLRLKEALR